MTDRTSDLDVVGELTPLRRYALTLTRDLHEAEDLVQDTLAKAFEKREQLRTAQSLRAWLMSILHNRFVDRERSRRAEAARHAEFGLRLDRLMPASQEASMRLADVRRAFMSLPVDQRAALHLITLEGLSYEQAAAQLGIPVGTLVSRLVRGRARLKELENGSSSVVVPFRTSGRSDAS
jgi:RNA polymerase sigma-70 factor, ECF subfamily